MSTKQNPGPSNCYANALPDEPMFILLARDPHAPESVIDWLTRRATAIGQDQRPISDTEKVAEACQVARDMATWRASNNGR